jgi:hypothetical protein
MEWYQLLTDESLNQIYTNYTIVLNALAGALGVTGRWAYKRWLKGVRNDTLGTGQEETTKD